MKRLLLLALVPGCYLEARGTVEAAVHHADSGSTAHDLAAAAGFGASDKLQSGAVLFGVEASPLVASATDAGAVRLPLMSIGGRYERAFTAAHPTVRGYTRFSFAFNYCQDSAMSAMPDPSCGADAQRAVGVESVALGVALTSTTTEYKEDEHPIVPGVVSIGLGLALTHAQDEALGDATFLGLELALGMGGDPITPFMSREGH